MSRISESQTETVSGPSTPSPKRVLSKSRQRAQNFRVKKGTETVDKLNNDLDKKLFIGDGLIQTSKFLMNLDLSTSEEAVRISVSTRGPLLMASLMWNRLSLQFGERFWGLCDVNALFRATLLQMAYQLQVIDAAQTKSTMDAHQRMTPMHFEMAEAVKMNPVQFSPVCDVINAIGNCRFQDTEFYPNTTDHPAVDPLHVTAHNLRATVNALSAEQYPAEDRLRFYESSPLFGAVWHVDPVTGPILLNPDDVMPPDYGAAQARADFLHLKIAIDFVCRKFPRLRGECTYSVEGSPGLLVSSTVYNTSTAYDADRHLCVTPQFDASGFWQMRTIPAAHYAMGVVGLFGEVYGNRQYEQTRSSGGAVRSGIVSWSNAAEGLLSSLM